VYRWFSGTHAQAAGLHLGLIIALEMDNFLNDCCRLGKLDWCTRFVHDRYMIQRASEINWECWTVEILALSQVVDKVEYHPCALHEGQPKNGAD
jgi:hypothetical protein